MLGEIKEEEQPKGFVRRAIDRSERYPSVGHLQLCCLESRGVVAGYFYEGTGHSVAYPRAYSDGGKNLSLNLYGTKVPVLPIAVLLREDMI